jgi:hypothetical protein
MQKLTFNTKPVIPKLDSEEKIIKQAFDFLKEYDKPYFFEFLETFQPAEMKAIWDAHLQMEEFFEITHDLPDLIDGYREFCRIFKKTFLKYSILSTKNLIKSIHIKKNKNNVSDEDYRKILKKYEGSTSTEMNFIQLKLVEKELK